MPSSKIRDYLLLSKFRLSVLVVISAILGYLMAAPVVDWVSLTALVLGGFLVTGSSNGFNQIIERDSDKLMDRTSDRPLPAGRMGVPEALIFSVIAGVTGIFILWYFLNPLSGILGTLALFIYAAIYTPLKKITPFSVFVGAFPGAVPPMLGWVAATGKFGLEPGILFAVQFVWQFPHFWAIAWKSHDDYLKAGFKLLPSKGGRDRSTAFQILVYSLFLLPVSLLPIMFGMAGTTAVFIAVIAGGWFALLAIRLFKTLTMKAATKLMFASFFYLPVILIAYLIDKIQ